MPRHTDTHGLHRSLRILMAAAMPALLVACSPSEPPAKAPVPLAVQTAMPVRTTLYGEVAGFGRLGADDRHVLALTLPQPGLVTSIAVLAGQRVQRGEPLLELVTDPAARRAYQDAAQALQAARQNLGRTRHLHADRLATNAQLDAARQALVDAQAALDAQRRLGGATATTTLGAPANGVVTAISVRRGQRVAAGAALLDFEPRVAFAAQLGVDPGSAAGIRAGMAVTLHPVYAAPGAPPLMGHVGIVGDAVDPQSHLVDVTVTLDAPTSLAAGTALSAVIHTNAFRAWAVPRAALQGDARGSYVFQIEHAAARRIDVTVLAPAGDPVGVAGALDPHAPVITLGSYEVSGGDPVQAAAAASAGTAAR